MPLIPVLFLTSAFWSGFWFVLVTRELTGLTTSGPFLIIGMALAALDFVTWTFYAYQSRPGAGGRDGLPFPGSISYMPVTGIGHLIPVAIIGILIAIRTVAVGGLFQALLLIAWFAVVTGVLLQKAEIILGGNYLSPVRAGKPLTRRQ